MRATVAPTINDLIINAMPEAKCRPISADEVVPLPVAVMLFWSFMAIFVAGILVYLRRREVEDRPITHSGYAIPFLLTAGGMRKRIR